jgi:S-adenosylmethionine-diacylglycerol 3-amino-3-carboxypropyl transferase
MDFYNRLNYSLGNEDWCVEEQALRVNSGDRVICVTASGDRPLHLLLSDCKEVCAVDMNPVQNYLLELKLAALRALDYEEYLSFLGCTATKHRYNIFTTKLKTHLSTKAAHYWDYHKKMIAKGIIYQGRVERLTNMAAKFISLVRRKEIKTLFSFDDIKKQSEYVALKWDTLWWRKFFDILLNPNLMKIILNDPGVISFIDPAIKPGRYIYDRMLQYLNHYPAKQSALIQLVLTGKVLPEAYFPYLTFAGYSTIRNNIHKLSIHTSNVIEYVTAKPNYFDCFSMSDIASYMSQENFEKLLKGILNAATPDARFCIRRFMSNHTVPQTLEEYFKRDTQLEENLAIKESNFVYRFMVGNIQK